MAQLVMGAMLVILGAAVLDVPSALQQPVAAGAGAVIAGLVAWELRQRRGGD